ncbi:hypothetical protein DICSQDRAFT_73608 [Dichomitus squalens LYAD-421 SS1]|uniref:Uncharacterized protein n=1 Tax=Dichomitus squalens (strain LYAD-421) TaxID=732165 RepID=R7SH94_DICSQ|nr:hypothetical protein DICSQDRAFT_73608 [Dichomitus squalens LYAD-421 SS1]
MIIAIRRQTNQAFPLDWPSRPDLVHEQSSILTQLVCAGPTSSFLARILA